MPPLSPQSYMRSHTARCSPENRKNSIPLFEIFFGFKMFFKKYSWWLFRHWCFIFRLKKIYMKASWNNHFFYKSTLLKKSYFINKIVKSIRTMFFPNNNHLCTEYYEFISLNITPPPSILGTGLLSWKYNNIGLLNGAFTFNHTQTKLDSVVSVCEVVHMTLYMLYRGGRPDTFFTYYMSESGMGLPWFNYTILLLILCLFSIMLYLVVWFILFLSCTGRIFAFSCKTYTFPSR